MNLLKSIKKNKQLIMYLSKDDIKKKYAVPSGLHHERSGRRDKFCAAVHPCLRWVLLRLRIQKERVTDDEEEGNLSFP